MAGSPPSDPLRFAACWRPKRATFCALVALVPPRGYAGGSSRRSFLVRRCLGDNCQYSAEPPPVGSRQLRLVRDSGQCSLVGCSCGLWNDRENDQQFKQEWFKRSDGANLEACVGDVRSGVVEQAAQGSSVAELCHGTWSATLISDTGSEHRSRPWRRGSGGCRRTFDSATAVSRVSLTLVRWLGGRSPLAPGTALSRSSPRPCRERVPRRRTATLPAPPPTRTCGRCGWRCRPRRPGRPTR